MYKNCNCLLKIRFKIHFCPPIIVALFFSYIYCSGLDDFQLVRKVFDIKSNAELRQVYKLEKLLAKIEDQFSPESGNFLNPISGLISFIIGFLTSTIKDIVGIVGLNELFVALRDGFSTAVTCLACRGLMMTIVNLNFDINKIADVFIKVCGTLQVGTQRVCAGVINLMKDEVDYIRKNTKLTAGEMCGVLMGIQCALFPSEKLSWQLEIPEKRKTDINMLEKGLKIVHITDIHLDPYYVKYGNTDCGKPLCCRPDSPKQKSSKPLPGTWGGYGYCDLPFNSLVHTFQTIADKHPNADYWLWTGDAVPHDYWKLHKQSNLEYIAIVTQFFRDYAPVPVLPVIGNHESVPVNSFPPPEITNRFSMSWLFDFLTKQWSVWLPESALQTFRRYGYYSLKLKTGLKIIALNVNYCLRVNYWNLLDPFDLGGQLQWLIDELLSAEEEGNIVHLIGHEPPDNRECVQAWLYNFLKIIERFEHIIKAQYYGHTHGDEFRVLYSLSNQSKPIGMEYVGPSISTYSDFNPAYRIYHIDSNGNLVDYETYFFNISEANQSKEPNWKLSYNPKETFNLNSMHYTDWNRLVQQMEQNEDVFKTYLKTHYRYSDIAIRGCDESCSEKLLGDLKVLHPFRNLPKKIFNSIM